MKQGANLRVIIWRDESLVLDSLDDIDSEIGDDDDENMDDLRKNILSNMIKIPHIVNTPFGNVSSTDIDNIMYERQMFSGHVNFYITSDLALKIMDVPGVDGLRILSPYSFAVSIGLCFFFGDVLADIENVLNVSVINEDIIDEEFENSKNEQTANKLLEENNELIKSVMTGVEGNKYWYIFVFPNGKSITEIFEDEEKMMKRKDFFVECSMLSNGVLLSSLEV